MRISKQLIINCIMIFIGASIFSFGLVNFNMANKLAEGGMTGIALIIYNLFNVSPAITTLVLNIPLIIIGLKFLGLEALFLTLVGTFSLSANIWIWQQFPLYISVDHDLLIAALLAGICGGFGSGIVYKFGGTTGGTDIVARIIEKKFNLTIGRSLLLLDLCVLLLSLTYLSLKEMMYTLIAVFVFSQVVDFVQDASYGAKAILIVSNKDKEIGEKIMAEMGRGVTYIKTQGGYSKKERDMVYCVCSMSEMNKVKEISHEIDDTAFMTIFTINEVLGEGFSYEEMMEKIEGDLQ
ncbi:YitT family protein [Vagococcus jeotgali]|uniref:YitT family protein n=1 Tax=Vagococcus jeotgali TaxID=3109030 RepID=UPI002DDAD1F4|nr:YitT family protein [Vagococcus sp. B2T-5]